MSATAKAAAELPQRPTPMELAAMSNDEKLAAARAHGLTETQAQLILKLDAAIHHAESLCPPEEVNAASWRHFQKKFGYGEASAETVQEQTDFILTLTQKRMEQYATLRGGLSKEEWELLDYANHISGAISTRINNAFSQYQFSQDHGHGQAGFEKAIKELFEQHLGTSLATPAGTTQEDWVKAIEFRYYPQPKPFSEYKDFDEYFEKVLEGGDYKLLPIKDAMQGLLDVPLSQHEWGHQFYPDLHQPCQGSYRSFLAQIYVTAWEAHSPVQAEIEKKMRELAAHAQQLSRSHGIALDAAYNFPPQFRDAELVHQDLIQNPDCTDLHFKMVRQFRQALREEKETQALKPAMMEEAKQSGLLPEGWTPERFVDTALFLAHATPTDFPEHLRARRNVRVGSLQTSVTQQPGIELP